MSVVVDGVEALEDRFSLGYSSSVVVESELLDECRRRWCFLDLDLLDLDRFIFSLFDLGNRGLGLSD